jgi:hypothetical protein
MDFFLVKTDRLEPLPRPSYCGYGKIRPDLTYIVSVYVTRQGVTHDVCYEKTEFVGSHTTNDNQELAFSRTWLRLSLSCDTL